MPSSKPKQFDLRQSDSMAWSLETDNGSVTLEATIRTARVIDEWKRREYQDRLSEIFPDLEPDQKWEDLGLAERVRRNQHYSMLATIYATTEITIQNGKGKPRALALDPETLEELPGHIVNDLYVTAIRLNPQWAPVLPAGEEEEDGEDDPNE